MAYMTIVSQLFRLQANIMIHLRRCPRVHVQQSCLVAKMIHGSILLTLNISKHCDLNDLDSI